MHFRRLYAAFTLIELLTVIAIIGILAALVGPTLSRFRKGDAMLSGTRAMLNAVDRARQLAVSRHTTVYMVFVRTNFWDDFGARSKANFLAALTPDEKVAVTNVLGKQLTGYNFISLRQVDDQPGVNTPQYLASWQSLPPGSFIPVWKFALSTNEYVRITDHVTGQFYDVYGFLTNRFPFPSESAAFPVPPDYKTNFTVLPCVAFNYQGQLCHDDGAPLGHDVFIPLAHGSVMEPLSGGTKMPMFEPATAVESPPNNSINNYNLIRIDWLTGRAQLERQEVQ